MEIDFYIVFSIFSGCLDFALVPSAVIVLKM